MAADRPLHLAPNLVVGPGSDTTYRGRLGPILVEPDTADIWALAPARLGIRGGPVTVIDGPHGGSIISTGEARLTLTSARRQDACHLVGAIPLTQIHIATDPYLRGNAVVAPRVHADVWSLIEQRVFVTSEPGRRVEAVVRSVDSQFRMANPLNEAPTVFDNAIELQSIDGAPLVRRGDAGALVTTERGDWLGIVVAGRGGHAFAAPLQPVVSGMGLEVIAYETIVRHNKALESHRPAMTHQRTRTVIETARLGDEDRRAVRQALAAMADA